MPKRVKAQLTYPTEMYDHTILKSGILTEQEIRAEYMRLRNVANKRLKRMGETEFAKTNTYKTHVNSYKKPQSQLTLRDLAYELSDLASFVSSDRSSISGQKAIRQKKLDTLHYNKYDFVTKSNFLDFTDFMDDWRSRKIDMIYTSEQVAELFEVGSSKKITTKELKKHFGEYMDNKEKLAKMPMLKTKSGKPKKAAAYRKVLGIK